MFCTNCRTKSAEQAVKSQPDNAASHLILASALMAKREYARAEEELTTLSRKYPKWSVVHAQMGTLAFLRKNNAAARQSYETAAREDPALLEALAGLIAVDVSEKKMSEARARVEVLRNPGELPKGFTGVSEYSSSKFYVLSSKTQGIDPSCSTATTA